MPLIHEIAAHYNSAERLLKILGIAQNYLTAKIKSFFLTLLTKTGRAKLDLKQANLILVHPRCNNIMGSQAFERKSIKM